MSIYVLDTDICIYWLNGRERLQEKVRALGVNHLHITMITYAELRYGAYKSQRVAENLQKIDEFLRQIKILAFDRESADIFGKTKADLKRKGIPLSDFDLLIAAITLKHQGILATNNIRHFERIDDLKYENWLES